MLATMTKPTVAETLLDLPRDHTARRPTLEDLDAVHASTVAADTAVLNSPDTTRADVHDWLTDPDVDLSRDAWLMHDPTGALVAWSWVAARPGAANVDVDFYVLAKGRCCLPTLLPAAEQRAVEIVAAGGHDAAVLTRRSTARTRPVPPRSRTPGTPSRRRSPGCASSSTACRNHLPCPLVSSYGGWQAVAPRTTCGSRTGSRRSRSRSTSGTSSGPTTSGCAG